MAFIKIFTVIIGNTASYCIWNLTLENNYRIIQTKKQGKNKFILPLKNKNTTNKRIKIKNRKINRKITKDKNKKNFVFV